MSTAESPATGPTMEDVRKRAEDMRVIMPWDKWENYSPEQSMAALDKIEEEGRSLANPPETFDEMIRGMVNSREELQTILGEDVSEEEWASIQRELCG